VSFSHDQFGHPGATTASAGSATNRRHHWAKSGDASYRGVTVSVRLSAPARREQILDVAVQVFARQGFHSTSMNDVADAAGVTKPVLYQHFASKHDLYMALLDEAGTRLRTRITTAVADARTGKEQTELGFKAYFRWVADDHDAFLLLFGLVGLAEAVSRHMVERNEAFDPDVLGQQIADLAWAGLRAVHRA
jgi:AcrR family transcriptional regulator